MSEENQSHNPDQDPNPDQVSAQGPVTNEDRTEIFLTLLSEHEQAVKVYVIAMVPVTADAEDILQETRLAMWKDFDRFEIGTNFRAWARRVAYHRILDFRKRKGRETKWLTFSDSFYETVSDAAVALEDAGSHEIEEIESLVNCVSQLQERHRQMILLRYKEKLSIEDVAHRVNRTVQATYRSLSRIRASIKICMTEGAAT